MANKVIDYEGYRIEQFNGSTVRVFRPPSGLVYACVASIEAATRFIQEQSDVRRKFTWAYKLGAALEAWLPVRDLLMDQAELVLDVRDDCIESCCPNPSAYGEPYDLSLVPEERQSIDPLQALLDRSDTLLGTDFGAPLVYHWDGDDLPDNTSEDITEALP